MDEMAVLEVSRQAVWVMLLVSAPMMVIALVVGVAIALIQALTTVQEMTLTFVPKMVAMLVIAIVTLPFMLTTMVEFTHGLFDRIVAGG
ncbi:MAG: flagellar biosynthesis protein FliQ [Rhodospirillales bacterium]|jgi:flagellar biosynthetic protein FliQ|nr:flagellar biosynthesis protein FliQ [Rhodospirillales bacterium]